MTKIISRNPSRNFEPTESVDISSFEEVIEKVNLAHEAQIGWGALTIAERIRILREIISLFGQKRDVLAMLMSTEMGMPISEAMKDMGMGMEYLEWYLDNGEKLLAPEITYEDEKSIHKVYYEPRGVVAVIVPWNFPFSNFIWQAGQNLIAGNAIILKHSKEVSLFGKALENIFSDSQIPKGVFNEVYGGGEVGDFLSHQDIDMICFTGSTNVGKKLYQIGAEKIIPVLMELGGSAPGIVFEDADIDSIIDSIYFWRFLNCGQVCDGLKRLIVHKDRFDEVVERLKKIILTKKIGVAEEKETDLGPLASEKQLATLRDQVQEAVDAGATVIIGGKCPQNPSGAFYEPTLLIDIKQTMKVRKEEVFGPVLPIVSFETYEEAIRLANDTEYGLGGYIFTQDRELYEKTARALKTGMVTQNNLNYLIPHDPFGGYKRSGIGREHGKYGFHEVSQVKIIVMEK